MIQFVQTGEYRTKSIRIKRFVNGAEKIGDGFPIVESLLNAFGNEEQVSDVYLDSMTAAQYSERVDAFKAYLLAKYAFLSAADFINNASGTDNTACVPGHVTSSGSISITQETEITIFFDSSGSMNSTLSPLLEMRNTLLKAALLPFYGMDELKYNEKVKVISDGSERTMYFLNNRNNLITDPTLIMVFQDESNNKYHTSSSFEPRRPQFESDITALRNTIGSLQANLYRGVIFQVTRSASEGIQFKNFIQAVQNGSAAYPAGFNLLDRPEIEFQYDVVNGSSPQYYMDIIIQKMRELGYRL